jgi:hypothetical protein
MRVGEIVKSIKLIRLFSRVTSAAFVSIGLFIWAVPAGASSSSTPPPPILHAPPTYKWVVLGLGTPSYYYGGLTPCGPSVINASKPTPISCALSFSVATTVSGTVQVGYGLISATLGYSVTNSIAVTGTIGTTVAKGQTIYAYYQLMFVMTPVYQQEIETQWTGATSVVATATASVTSYAGWWVADWLA